MIRITLVSGFNHANSPVNLGGRGGGALRPRSPLSLSVASAQPVVLRPALRASLYICSQTKGPSEPSAPFYMNGRERRSEFVKFRARLGSKCNGRAWAR